MSQNADERSLSMSQEDERPGFRQMIADALPDEKPFDTIIVHDLSRFSKSVSDPNQYRKRLEETGAGIMSATEPDAS